MGATILVAEADKTVRELMTAVLAREGFRVAAVHDVGDAVARCREEAPELVLASVLLPGAAADLCKQMRTISPAQRIVLLVSGADVDGRGAQALAGELGCDAVLARPFRYPALRELLSGWGLALPGRKEARPAPPVSFSVPVPEPARFDIETIAAPEPPRPGAPTAATAAQPDAPVQEPAGAALPIPIPLGAPLDPALMASLATVAPSPAAPAEAELPLDDLLAAAPPGPPAGELDLDAIAVPTPAGSPASLAEANGARGPPAAVSAPAAPASAGLGRASFFAAARPAQPAAPLAAAVSAPAATPRRDRPPATPLEAATVAAVAPRVSAADARRVPSPAPAPSQPAREPDGEPKRALSLPAGLPASGDLRAVPLPRIVFELYVSTFSGRLHLAREGLNRIVYFWGGLPVRVDSDRVEESLGRLLVEHGRITQEQHEAALAAATAQHIGEAEALLATGDIQKSELLGVLAEQTEQRLANSFSWRDGAYRIEADAAFGEAAVLTEIHPLRAIWRGVSEHYDLVSLMTYFGALRDQYVVGTALFAVHFDTLGPFLRKLDVVSLLDGRRTFEAALRSDDARALEVAQALYVLLVTDMARASPGPGDPVSVPARGEPETEMSAPADYRALTRICDEVNREYLRVKESDYFDALRVEMDSDLDAIDAAYANIVRPFTLEALPAGLPEDVQHRAAEICSILARARGTIRVPELRERYIVTQRARYVAEDQPEARGAAGPGAPRFIADVDLDLDQAADQERETRQLAERAYADAQRLAKAGDVEMAQQKLAVAVRLNGREPGYRVALARIVLAAKEDDAAARRDAAALLQQALKLDPSHVEANFELAKLLVAVGQHAMARPCVMRVLQRAPEHREARALLAKLAAL